MADGFADAQRAYDSMQPPDQYIVELHRLGVGPTELARVAGMTRSGIDAVLRRETS